MSQLNKEDESNNNLFTFSAPPCPLSNFLKFGLQITMYIPVRLIETKIKTKLILLFSGKFW
jgi:hypothetical protein